MKLLYRCGGNMNIGLTLQKNDPLKKTIDWFGMKIGVEWPKGSIRKYANSDFKKYMYASYGYVKGTSSRDGEEMDVYVKESGLEMAKFIYKIRQMSDPKESGKDWSVWDENKYMLGFSTMKEAKDTYIKCMTPKHFGGITRMEIKDFRAAVTRSRD